MSLNDRESGVKKLQEQFTKIEQRVRALAAENIELKRQLQEVEQEMRKAQQEVRELQTFHNKKVPIREKLERVLRSLEALDTKGDDPEQHESAHTEQSPS